MTKELIKTLTQPDSFDPLVTVSFKVPFSMREQLKKHALHQGKTLDTLMKELISNTLTVKLGS